jgi:DNA-binding NarL/FixJ family response regulator
MKTKGKSLLVEPAGDTVGLAHRDRVVLRHLSKGLSNRELAAELGVSVRTAKYYLSQLFKKMRVRTRIDAILKARQMHLG